jgi:DNA repair exonuclease SbcCD ATPase subunit
MDVPPPEPPRRDAPDLHGEHGTDPALSKHDGELLDKLDKMIEQVTVAAAGPGSGDEAEEIQFEAMLTVDMVVEQWSLRMHGHLYDRLAKLKKLEESLGSGSGDEPALRRELRSTKQVVERLMAENAQKTEVAESLRSQLRRAHEVMSSEPARGSDSEEVARLKGERATLVNTIDRLTDQLNAAYKAQSPSSSSSSEEVERLRVTIAALEDEGAKLRRQNLGLTQRLEASRAQTAEAKAVPGVNAQRIMDLEALVKELQSEQESFHQEIRDLENTKAVLEEELEEARKAHDRLVDAEAEKESLHAQLEEVEEERDVCKEDYEELSARSAENESNTSDLREEVARLHRIIEDIEAEEVEGDEEARVKIRELLKDNRTLQNEIEDLHGQMSRLLEEKRRRGVVEEERSRGATTPEGRGAGESEHSLELHRRIRSLEEADRILHETNARLLREVSADRERLTDLEAENRALRYSAERSPAAGNVAGLEEANRRYREQLAQLMAERRESSPPSAVAPASGGLGASERAELDILRQRNYELELKFLKSKVTKMSEAELTSKLVKAEKEAEAAEQAVTAQQAAIKQFRIDRRAGITLENKPKGMTLDQEFDWNRAEANRNRALLEDEKAMFTQLQELISKRGAKRRAVTRLRNQVTDRQKLAVFMAEAPAEALAAVAQEEEGDEEEEDDEPAVGPESPFKLQEEESKRKKLEALVKVGRKVLVF